MNIFDIVKLPHRTEHPMCTRAKISTGTLCNYRCSFCYYHDRTFAESFENIKKTVLKYRELGMTSYDLSGGEPTVHPDFFKILELCSKFGKVSCVSNGRAFASRDFCEKAKEKGLSEVLFSWHGLAHDAITGVKDSSDKIKKALSYGFFKKRVNCTVCKENYETLEEFIKEIPDVFEVNFIIENPWYQDFNLDQRYFDVHQCGKILDRCCRELEARGILARVRYIPFCAMKEKRFIANYFQHIYDPYDWNLLYILQENDKEKFFNLQPEDVFRTCLGIAKNQRKFYSKKGCSKCQYSHICDGIKDLNKPKPQLGRPILDPLKEFLL